MTNIFFNKSFITLVNEASSNKDFAKDLTHSLYRYPASMSPFLVRQIIKYTTKPNDLILDPFCGGGTTAVEAISNGRRVICSDINHLATFVTSVKSLPLKDKYIIEFEKWALNSLIKLKTRNSFKSITLKTKNGKIIAPKTYSILLFLRDLANKIDNKYVNRIALITILQSAKYCFDCNRNSGRCNNTFTC